MTLTTGTQFISGKGVSFRVVAINQTLVRIWDD